MPPRGERMDDVGSGSVGDGVPRVGVVQGVPGGYTAGQGRRVYTRVPGPDPRFRTKNYSPKIKNWVILGLLLHAKPHETP